jgi:hypothetical protein
MQWHQNNNMNFSHNLNFNTADEAPRELEDLPLRKKRLFNKARAMSLTQEEKQVGMLSFKNFIESKEHELPLRSPYFSQLMSIFAAASVDVRKRVLVPIAAILIFLLAGSTCFAAGEALPGDALYSIKVNVNERVETFFAAGDEASAKVAANHASVRLEEAERLAVQGRLNVAAETYLSDKFMSEAEKVEHAVVVLQATGNARAAEAISSDFETSLGAHNTVISQLNAKDKDNLNKIKQSLGGHLEATEILRANAEATVNATSGAPVTRSNVKDALASTKKHIDEAESYINSTAATSQLQTSTAAQARLNIAKSMLIQSEAKIDGGQYGEAATLIKGASRVADEAKKTAKSTMESAVGNSSWHGNSSATVNTNINTNSKVETNNGPGASNAAIYSSVNVHDVQETPSTTSSSAEVQSATQAAAPVFVAPVTAVPAASLPAAAAGGAAAAASVGAAVGL